jgi:hypothetical protein
MDLHLYLGILKEGLKLWNTKEGQKYLDEVIKLEKEYYEEFSKPEDERSQLFLDDKLLHIRILSQGFIQRTGKK